MLKRIPFPYRITILYLIFGALWILFSDVLLVRFTNDPHRIQQLSTYKGWLFVLVTGILLFSVIRSEIRSRTQLFNELLEAKEKAVEANRLKTTFLSNLSHYIRTPMNSILGFIELIEDKDTSPENHETFLAYVNQSSQSLLHTLTSIIEISKIQEGQNRVTPRPVDLVQMMESLAGSARIEIAQKKTPIKVSLEFDPEKHPDPVLLDPDKVHLILASLLSNAVRFTVEGEIKIGCHSDGTHLQFWVQDTGPGIPAAKQPLLFSNFLQNEENTRISGEGSGLGLALSASLTKLLGGDLSLEKTGPEGSTFILRVPISS